ncbi:MULTISPECIES: hypothetical protein [Devosia]|uniref:hypothetical protein n=1 Tax=Devosia TaxID=46913 RepID=UPI0027372E6D|nr:hypothetical protein [Devosia sp.]MDP2782730.1 hypothetical protein [Devosia sp.]
MHDATKYDRSLEAASDLRGCPTITLPRRAISRRQEGATTQIDKFHGNFANDATLVLAKTYFSRLSFEASLNVKFKADASGWQS